MLCIVFHNENCETNTQSPRDLFLAFLGAHIFLFLLQNSNMSGLLILSPTPGMSNPWGSVAPSSYSELCSDVTSSEKSSWTIKGASLCTLFFLVSLFCCLLISTYVQNYLVKLVGILCIASYVESKFHGSGTLGVFFTAVPRVWHTQFSPMLNEPGHLHKLHQSMLYLCTWERVMIGLLPHPCVLQTFIGHS